MCGIAGLMKLAGPLTVEDIGAVLRMLEAQVHRGPDDWGLLLPDSAMANADVRALLGPADTAHVRTYPSAPDSPGAVLGARRLAIIDPSSRGRMPMGTADGRRWIAYNGETYNYRELRAELKGAGDFTPDTDPEVILRSLDVWGPAALPRLRGMFALACFESGPPPRLLLARDRFGIKPLYWHQDRTQVLFASEVAAGAGRGLVPDRIDRRRRRHRLRCGGIHPRVGTHERGRALPPAH